MQLVRRTADSGKGCNSAGTVRTACTDSYSDSWERRLLGLRERELMGLLGEAVTGTAVRDSYWDCRERQLLGMLGGDNYCDCWER